MKKTKRFGKTQFALAIMVVALVAAVGLNMKYSAEQAETDNDTSSKYLGQAEYVNASVENESREEYTESDYFKELRENRQSARDEALDILESTLNRKDITEAQRQEAVDRSTVLANAAEQEGAIETVLKAKGFKTVLAVIGEDDVNVIIDKEPNASEITQIQDAVLSHTQFTVANIKIITAEEN